MTREALKQALEALGKAKRQIVNARVAPHGCIEEAITAIKAALAKPVQPADKDAEIARLTACLKAANANAEKFERDWYLRGDEIEAIKVQPDNTSKLYEELRSIIDSGSESFTHKDAVQYLKDNLASEKWTPEDAAYRPGGLAQPEQNLSCKSTQARLAASWGYVKAQPKQEPVAWWDAKLGVFDEKHFDQLQPLYTSPPKRQPLTDAEIDEIELPPSGTATVRDMVRLIEAAHGIGDKT